MWLAQAISVYSFVLQYHENVDQKVQYGSLSQGPLAIFMTCPILFIFLNIFNLTSSILIISQFLFREASLSVLQAHFSLQPISLKGLIILKIDLMLHHQHMNKSSLQKL